MAPADLRWSGSKVCGILCHRMGLARPLSRLCLSAETSRRLTVRYDGFAEVTLLQARHGISPVSIWTDLKAFPVPGRLAGSPPTGGWLLD